jgi:RND family efflux transporter MFP subunit
VENQVDVLAQREGMVAQVAAELGSRVQKGQLLAQLDDRQLLADRDAAEAKIKTIEADVQTWEAEAKVLQNDYERDQEMFKANLITAKQLEHSRYKQIGSGYQLEGVRQQLKTAKANFRSLELEIEKTRITAPFAGVVARRYVRNGQKVALNDRLFWVTATEPVNVQFTLPDSFVGKIASGSSVTVISQQAPELKTTARVKAVSPVADPASSTIEVIAELTGAPAGMTPGTTAVVRVPRAK